MRKIFLFCCCLSLCIFFSSCDSDSWEHTDPPYDVGYEEGYAAGYDVGFEEGCAAGYKDGIYDSTALIVEDLLGEGAYSAVQSIYEFYGVDAAFGPFIADKNKLIIHCSDCPFVMDLLQERPQDIKLPGLSWALENGYSPCPFCNPQ